MVAPPNRVRGAKRIYCNDVEARILKAVGWTEATEDREIRAEILQSSGSVIPPEAKPKRKYTRRVKTDEADELPRRRYRRRDMQADEE